MSGGSYNYLCYKDAHELLCDTETLERMADRLLELKCDVASENTYKLLNQIKKTNMLLELMSKDLFQIWRDVEWFDSSDICVDSVRATYIEYLKSNGGSK